MVQFLQSKIQKLTNIKTVKQAEKNKEKQDQKQEGYVRDCDLGWC